MEPLFIGEICAFGGNFAPRNWAFCDGQLLPISQNTALFSILGMTYGGDGRTTFALPDLRGRSPVHAGHGPGLPDVRLGEKGGAPTFSLNLAKMPSHSHTMALHAETDLANNSDPTGRMLAAGPLYADVVAADDRTMAATSIRVLNTGGNIPVNKESPYEGVNFIIALYGAFPSRG